MNNEEIISLSPIGQISSCYTEKFGVPRQAGLVDKAHSGIALFSPYNRKEMFKDIEQFTHIWVIFLFHDAIQEGWRPTVRPPGLGGQRRVGVFASRSPHRPNFIGISAVRLISVLKKEERLLLVVAGGDFLDGTPVLDIKPYVPFSDVVEEASAGFSAQGLTEAEVRFSTGASKFCHEYLQRTGKDLAGVIEQVLQADPRPASQKNKKRIFGMQLWQVNVRWRVENEDFIVTDCSPVS